MNKQCFSPEVISLISRQDQEGYYCPICSLSLRPYMETPSYLICSIESRDHDFDALSYDSAIFTYRTGENFDDKMYEVHINYVSQFTSIIKYSNLLQDQNNIKFDYVIDNLNFRNVNSIIDQLEMYFLLS